MGDLVMRRELAGLFLGPDDPAVHLDLEPPTVRGNQAQLNYRVLEVLEEPGCQTDSTFRVVSDDAVLDFDAHS